MSCAPPPTDNSRQIRALESRVRALEKEISGIKELTGVCMSGPELIVLLYSAVYDGVTGKYTITFASTPGAVYQVQQSVDGIVWEVSDPATVLGATCADCPPAEASQFDNGNDYPWMSLWTSNGTWPLDELPIWFRVRQVPRAILCAPSKPC
jgi:hypothetical protein